MIETLVLASHNRHKVKELAAMLSGRANVRGLLDYDRPPDVEETGATFRANAMLKAEAVAAWLVEQHADVEWVLADDSGLCVDVLGGRPGVFSARFSGPAATDEENNRKLVHELTALGVERSAAHYECALALTRTNRGKAATTMSPGIVLKAKTPLGGATSRAIDPASGLAVAPTTTLSVVGRCCGWIRTVRRGSGGFGYDPYFWVDEDTRTFAELTRAAKAARSHRGDALRQMLAIWPA
ncbi:MAG: non-canonical purine NTP pyrophosphatase [Nannocystaceae bacterium]